MSTKPDDILLTPELRAWLMATARGLWQANSRIGAEDLAQEGWIAMWAAQSKLDGGKGNGMAYLRQCARRRMVDVLRSARYYTKAGRKPINLELPVPTIDDGDSEDGAVKIWDELAIGDNIDALVLAYHEGEIWRAIGELPSVQRDYVVLRFYRGFNDLEARTAVGKPNSNGLWSTVKATLHEKLDHLVSV